MPDLTAPASIAEVVDDGLPRVHAFLTSEISAGLVMTGAQVCAIDHRDRVHRLALGDAGQPVEHATLFCVYCAIKPITTVAVAKLVDDGLVELDEPLRARLPSFRALSSHEITLRHVLDHTAGLHAPSAKQIELVDPARRSRFLQDLDIPDGWRPGVDAAYSEFFGWYLLGLLLEDVTGCSLREHLRDAVLAPLGLHDTWIGMTEAEYEANVSRIGLNSDLRQHRAFPVLSEHNRRFCCECNCAYAGYTTASDLARFYAQLLHQLDGGAVPALPSPETLLTFVSPARARTFDLVFQRESNFGLGFMTQLSDHSYGAACSPRAFGQSGWSGTSFAWADPARGLAACLLVNGMVDGAASSLRRELLVEQLYLDLGHPARFDPP